MEPQQQQDDDYEKHLININDEESNISTTNNNNTTSSSFRITKRGVLIGLVAFLGVAAVVGAVIGTQLKSSSSSSNSASSSSSSSSSPSLEQIFTNRPVFQQVLSSLKTAPAPTVYASTANTTSARLSFVYTEVSAVDPTRISHTYLHYDVEKNNNAYCLSKFESVVAVACKHPTRLGLRFVNASVAQDFFTFWSNSTVLFMRPEWGCGTHIRQFVSHPQVSGEYIYVNTTNVTLDKVFANANLSFFTNHSEGGPDSQTVLQSASTPSSPNGIHVARHNTTNNKQRRGFFSWLEHGIEDVVDDVVDVVVAVVDVAEFIVTGDFNHTWSPYSSQYIMPTQIINFEPSFNDTSFNGYAALNAQHSINTEVELNIQDYSVTSFSASLTASAYAGLEAQIFGEDQYSAGNAYLLTQREHSFGVIHVFEIPVAVSLVVSLYGGYSFNTQGNFSISGSFSAEGSVTAGISYTPDSGVATTSSHNYGMTHNWGNSSYQAEANLRLFVAPELYLQFDYIGGPVGKVAVFGDLKGAFANDITNDDNTNDNTNDNTAVNTAADNTATCIEISADAGFEVQIAGRINISIPHITDIEDQTKWYTLYGPHIFWGPENITQICF